MNAKCECERVCERVYKLKGIKFIFISLSRAAAAASNVPTLCYNLVRNESPSVRAANTHTDLWPCDGSNGSWGVCVISEQHAYAV